LLFDPCSNHGFPQTTERRWRDLYRWPRLCSSPRLWPGGVLRRVHRHMGTGRDVRAEGICGKTARIRQGGITPAKKLQVRRRTVRTWFRLRTDGGQARGRDRPPRWLHGWAPDAGLVPSGVDPASGSSDHHNLTIRISKTARAQPELLQSAER
jgi:hypothetical protein